MYVFVGLLFLKAPNITTLRPNSITIKKNPESKKPKILKAINIKIKAFKLLTDLVLNQ